MAVAMLASCGGAKTQNTETSAQDKSETSTEVINNDLRTADLSFCDVHGPVKSIQEDYYQYEFSADGQLVSVLGDKDVFTRTEPVRVDASHELSVYKRNEKGEICEILHPEGYTNYTWENGRVVSSNYDSEGSAGAYKFIYDENGDLKSICGHEIDGDEDDNSSVNCREYKITKRDSHGNWIERELVSDDPFVEKRTIEYYK